MAMAEVSRRTLQFCSEVRRHLSKYMVAFFTRAPRYNGGLPLALARSLASPNGASTQTVDTIIRLLEEMLELIISKLHDVQKNLLFWQSLSEGTNSKKLQFMILKRGPIEFFKATIELVHGVVTQGFHTQHIGAAAAAQISENVASLKELQRHLSALLAKIYKQVNTCEDQVFKQQNQEAMFLMLVSIQCSVLEDINKIMANAVSVHHASQSSFIFQFEKIPDELKQKSIWTDSEIKSAANLMSSNMRGFDRCLSMAISKYRRPRRAARSWLKYTGTAIGIAACSTWILSHSKLMGSSDLDNWIKEAKESTTAFWKDHVESPIISIRDELFETFRKRHQSTTELAEVHLTANSLHRMLHDFCEEASGKKLPAEMSDQELMEMMISRYEKELAHPLQNLLAGDLGRAFLIQIQKLKLDIETAMLELNQILRANEINFAVLAALPAFFLTFLLGALVRISIAKDRSNEGKGAAARLYRRLLIGELEEKIIDYQVLIDQNQDEIALRAFGMVLYILDRLYKTTEGHAKASGEWRRLQADIIMLANPSLATQYKLAITLRMVSAYECLLPSSRRLF